MFASRIHFLLLICCLIFYLGLGFTNNVDVRKFIRIKPLKSDNNKTYHFGKQLELKRSGDNVVLYVGAPSVNNPEESSGSVFTCDVNIPTEDKSEQTCSSTWSFAKSGALGLSLGLDESKENLIVCGNQYTFKCGRTSFMVGSCYKRNLVDSSNNLLNTPCTSNCLFGIIADIVFALDESGSVSSEDFATQLDWVIRVLTIFKNNIDKGDVRVGVVVFAHANRYLIPLKRYSFTELKLLIQNIRQRGGGTRIASAIKRCHDAIENDGRPSVSHQMIVLTDGDSSGDILVAANNARSDGIVTFAVGVGTNVNANTLLNVAGNENRLFKANNFNQLGEVTDRLTEGIQSSADIVLEGQGANTTNELTQCQIGSSSHISKKGNVYIGAVGASDRSGSIINYYKNISEGIVSTEFSGYIDENELKKLIRPTNFSDFKESYLGYSVTTGQFMGHGIEQVASGAPRYKSKGAVFIYDPKFPTDESSSGALLPNRDPTMWQLGAYFGHSVCSVDLNKDSFDDLLVSSPLFLDDASSYDQGRVFFFLNNKTQPGILGWMSGTYQPQILMGSNAIGARFGMSIVIGGDIDRNGYDDIIIGAPGEEASSSGSGAVYVYFVTSDGISESNKQRILGKSVDNNLQGFGGGLLGGTGNSNDIDGNQYPEIVMSAPSSDDVVVLFSRPVVDVTTRIVNHPATIDVVKCLSGVNETCTSFTFCVSAQDITAETIDPFNMTFDIELDSLVQDDINKRLVFRGQSVSRQSFTRRINVTETCLTYDLTLKTRAFSDDAIFGSFDVPLMVVVLYDFTQAHKNEALSGVFNSELQQRSASAEWRFLTECSGENGTCLYDLEVTATTLLPESIMNSENFSQPHRFERNPGVLSVNVTLSNIGQEYVLFAGMNFSSGLLFLNQVIGNCATRRASSNPQGIDELSFKISRSSTLKGYILPLQSCNFVLRYPLHVLTDSAVVPNITIRGNAFSSAGQGIGRDINPSNNKFMFSRQVRYTAKLELSGSSKPNRIDFNRTAGLPLALTLEDDVLDGDITEVSHEHNIYHTGDHLLPKASMTFTWPSALSANKTFPLLYLVDFACTPAVACQCDVAGKVNYLNITSTQQSNALFLTFPDRVELEEKTNCKAVHCDVIECFVSQLNPFASIKVKASFVIWHPALSQENLITELSSYLQIDTSESRLSGPKNKYMSTATSVYAQDQPSPSSSSDEWDPRIVAGVVVGILVLTILGLVVLHKVGFFKSTYAEMLDAAKQQENTDDAPAGVPAPNCENVE